MTEIEKLLEPIAGENPCGEDFWVAEGRFLLQQPLEQAWKAGEEPNWGQVREAALQQIQRSRDLRSAVVLCLALFQTDGLQGFRDGLVLIRGLLEKFWDRVHPMPGAPDDPIRANFLSNLSADLGSDTPYQFVKYLRETTLCKSAAGNAYSLADIQRAEGGKPAGEDSAQPIATMDQIEAAFRTAPNDKLQGTFELATAILESVKAIDVVVASKSAGATGINFSGLTDTLTQILDVLRPHVGGVDDLKSKIVSVDAKRIASEKGSPLTSLGGIRSRADADAVLAAVCAYFKSHEPSSPVPFLIERARRLLKMDFMESVRDMAPDSTDKFNALFGLKEREKTEEKAAGS